MRKVAWTCECRRLREELNLSIHAVAKAVELSVSSYWHIEQGGDLCLTTARRIANFFGLWTDEIWRPLPKLNE